MQILFSGLPFIFNLSSRTKLCHMLCQKDVILLCEIEMSFLEANKYLWSFSSLWVCFVEFQSSMLKTTPIKNGVTAVEILWLRDIFFLGQKNDEDEGASGNTQAQSGDSSSISWRWEGER